MRIAFFTRVAVITTFVLVGAGAVYLLLQHVTDGITAALQNMP